LERFIRLITDAAQYYSYFQDEGLIADVARPVITNSTKFGCITNYPWYDFTQGKKACYYVCQSSWIGV